MFPVSKCVNFGECIIKVFPVVWREQFSWFVETFPNMVGRLDLRQQGAAGRWLGGPGGGGGGRA